MKKLILVGLAVFVILCVGAVSYADTLENPKEIAIEVHVPVIFGLEVWDEEKSQTLYVDVGPIDAKTWKGTDEEKKAKDLVDCLGFLNIYVTTNHGQPWGIEAKSPGIPSPNGTTVPLYFDPFLNDADTTPGGGTIYRDLLLADDVAQIIYMPASGEVVVKGLQIHAAFKVNDDYKLSTLTKYDLAAGVHNTTLTLTLSE